MTTKRFQVALSFPGEQRVYVLQVAELLAKQLGKDAVFYDAWYKAELARPNLDTYLQAIYHHQSQLIVPFLCADYENKQWCGLEWRPIRDLIKKRQDLDIMPLRFDDADISGFFSTDGYIDLRTHNPEEIAELILLRLQDNSNVVIKYDNEQGAKAEQPKAIAKSLITSPVVKSNDDWQVIDNYKVKEGLAIDTETGLMWLRFAYGQTWQNGTAQGEAKRVNWENAFKAAEKFNWEGGYLGYNNWRLPTIDELKTLLNELKGEKGNYIHPDVFLNNNGEVFWSSSPDANGGASLACIVPFFNGYAGWYGYKNGNLQVRLVRSGQ